MPSPFPGIDPYIEAQGRWPDFHSRMMTYICDLANERLPDNYVALVEEEMHLVREPMDEVGRVRPDIAIAHDPSGAPAGPTNRITTLEPVTIPLQTALVEELRETWIEIRKLPELSLITVLEVLSPSNKVGVGRIEYLEKRNAYIERPIHIVELDLLLAGRRLPMRRPLPAGDFHAIVSRADRRPDADVYSWSIRDTLPAIPIPLEAPDPDIQLELARACEKAYNLGRYSRLLRYQEPLDLPLSLENRSWAESQAGRPV